MLTEGTLNDARMGENGQLQWYDRVTIAKFRYMRVHSAVGHRLTSFDNILTSYLPHPVWSDLFFLQSSENMPTG